MINKEDLTGNDKLKDLTPEHADIIVELSRDDDASIRKELVKVGETNATNILNDVATKIEDAFEIKRNDKEKTSDFVIRANEEHTTKQLSTQTEEITTLKAKIEAGITDEDTKEQLANLKKENGDMSSLLKSEEEKYKGLLSEKDKEFNSFKQDIDLKGSIPTLKSDLDKFSRDSRINQALGDLRSDYELVYDEKDPTKLVAKKDYKFYDPAEVLKSHPAISDVIEEARKQTGTGAGDDKSGANKPDPKPAPKDKDGGIEAPDKKSDLEGLKGIDKTAKLQELAKDWVENEIGLDILDAKYSEHTRAFVKQNS